MALWLFSSVGHINYLVGAALATQVSTTANFIGNEVFVFRGDKRGNAPFALCSVRGDEQRRDARPAAAASVCSSRFGIPTLIANVITLLGVFVVRFGISDRFIYSSGSKMQNKPTSERQRIGPVNVTTVERRHLRRSKHNVAGGADVGPFRHTLRRSRDPDRRQRRELPGARVLPGGTNRPRSATPDIVIRKGKVGRPRWRALTSRHTREPGVQWEEHFGRLSGNFSIDFGDQIKVTATGGLLASPHVLYTNVVEALLRFVFVDRGYMLLHSACLDMDGQGVMLSAATDTGKTGTILTLLRDTTGTFLSDDMTIVDGAGVALCFPKPLTISHHTLRAVNAGRLSAGGVAEAASAEPAALQGGSGVRDEVGGTQRPDHEHQQLGAEDRASAQVWGETPRALRAHDSDEPDDAVHH